jgi:hypothetical protein
MDNEIIEKAKVGDTKVYQGKTYVCAELNSKGQPKWRLQKSGAKQPDTVNNPPSGKSKQDDTDNNGGSQTTQQGANKKLSDYTPDELVNFANSASTAQLASAVNDKKNDQQARQIIFNVLKKRDDYDAKSVDSSDLPNGYVAKPTAKVQYKTKKPAVEPGEFSDWSIQLPSGRKTVSVSGLRKLYASKSDEDLLKLLNNTHADQRKRQLAYDEAAARGIPEDKIDVSGTLERLWKKVKTDHDIKENMNRAVNEDEVLPLTYDWKGLDHEVIMRDNFDDGLDPAWLDPDSPQVQKIFKTNTLSGRQKYDTFKDYYQRDPKLVPGYLTAQNKVNNLNGQMWQWAQSKNSPLFISAGGAGAGKTYGWRNVVAEDLSLPELEPGDDPNNTDWGYVMLTDNDAETDKIFAKTLAKYNGSFIGDDGEEHPHIIFLDDADRLLTTQSKPLMAMMKKINDADPKNRVFKNPDTGKIELWKGKIIITTNKDLSELSKNEDTKAILSRATKSDIHFTRNETLELLSGRYQNMELSNCAEVFERDGFTDDDIKDFKDDVFDYMLEHINDADPRKFTPRAFLELCDYIAPKWKNSSFVRKTGKGTAGIDIPWQISALDLLKAENNDIEKAEDYVEEMYSKNAMIAQKENLEKLMSEAKKNGNYEKLFGKRAQNAIIFGEDVSEQDEEKTKKSKKKVEKNDKVEKGLFDDMSLSEAEDILFS